MTDDRSDFEPAQEHHQQQQAPPRADYHPAPRPPEAPVQRSGGMFKGCLIALLLCGVFAVLAVGAVIVLAVVAAQTGMGMAPPAGVTTSGQFREVSVRGERGRPKIACIPVAGLIDGSAMPGIRMSQASLFVDRLRLAEADPNVRGVLLYVDSGGGAVTASDIMNQELRSFRRRTGAPVVACLMDVAASGGYYVAVGADRIVAHPTTITGSIGVMVPFYDATALLEKIGVQDESVTTGPFKDMLSPTARKTEQQQQRERELLQKLVNEIYDRFVKVVAEGRDMEVEAVRELADGRVFTSAQAQQHGLIDRMGYESDAREEIERLAGVTNPHYIRYAQIITISDVLGRYAEGPNIQLKLGEAVPATKGGRPMYLWAPGASDATE